MDGSPENQWCHYNNKALSGHQSNIYMISPTVLRVFNDQQGTGKHHLNHSTSHHVQIQHQQEPQSLKNTTAVKQLCDCSINIWYSVRVKMYVIGILQISICSNQGMWSLSHLPFIRAISCELQLSKGTRKNVFLNRNRYLWEMFNFSLFFHLSHSLSL